MRTLLATFLLVTAVTASAADCPTCAQSPTFNDACRLVTAPCDRAPIGDITEVLDALYSTGKPVVFYVHGRGEEPKKTSDDGIVIKLESEYGVGVLMFNWDSKGEGRRRPVDKAQASVPELRDVIGRIAAYRKAHPEKAAPTLLVHSMGSILLRGAAEGVSFKTDDGTAIFSNILVTGSDEESKGHADWVKKLAAKNTILFAVNKHDAVLIAASHPKGFTPLGRQVILPVAQNAFYLNATSLVGLQHRLFAKKAQKDNVAICRIFTAMMRGEKPDLAIGSTIRKTENDRVLFPIKMANRNDTCFQNAAPVSGDE